MASGRLIDYLGEGLFSARPVTPNLAAGALGLYYATDTNTMYAWDGSAWDTVGGGSGAPITATTGEAGTSLTATGANAWNYTRFTNAGTKTYTFDSAQTYANNAEYHGRNVGAGNLTIAQAGTFVITPPVGGSLVIPQGQSFFLKITGTNTADLILQSPSGTGPPSKDWDLTGATQNAYTTATSQNRIIPASAAVGDLLVAVVLHRDTLTPPAGWTLALAAVNAGTSPLQTVSIYYKTCVGGEPGASTTWTQATSQRISVGIASFRRSDGAGNAVLATNSNNGSAGLANPYVCAASSVTLDGTLAITVFSAFSTQSTAGSMAAMDRGTNLGLLATVSNTDQIRMCYTWDDLDTGDSTAANAFISGNITLTVGAASGIVLFGA